VAEGDSGRRGFRLAVADPDASPPLYTWRSAPPHLKTLRQLHEAGLRPGRQGVQGLVVWYGRGGRPVLGDGTRFAYLYDVRRARPRLRVTPAHAAAAARATAARRVCPECGVDRGYQPSRRLGHCNVCETAAVAA
jgi:hypothetical protein